MEGFTLPTFYLQCAWDTSSTNPMLRDKLAQRDQQLVEIDEDTDRSIRNLRTTLAWTVGGAIAVTLLLGWFLVGVGLFPLKRLSFAVSQITPKDLHLPIDPHTLPAEVNPVAVRLSQSLMQLQAAFEREKRGIGAGRILSASNGSPCRRA
jgi:signal transduction histidine kinase